MSLPIATRAETNSTSMRLLIPNRFQIETNAWREPEIGETDRSFFSLSFHKQERVGGRRPFGLGTLSAALSPLVPRGERGIQVPTASS
jgi:hypothetical protein